MYLFTSTGTGYPSSWDYEINDLTNSNANLGWSVSVFSDWCDGAENCVVLGAPGNAPLGYSNVGQVTVWEITE